MANAKTKTKSANDIITKNGISSEPVDGIAYAKAKPKPKLTKQEESTEFTEFDVVRDENKKDSHVPKATAKQVATVIDAELSREETPADRDQIERLAEKMVAEVNTNTTTSSVLSVKTLGNTDQNGCRKNVRDVIIFGDDLFKLMSKASSESEGWFKSTKCMDTGKGCVIQVTTQQRNSDGSYALAEAVTFVPGVKLMEQFDGEGVVKGRYLKSTN